MTMDGSNRDSGAAKPAALVKNSNALQELAFHPR